jgi:hypothetical protein
MLVKAIGHRSQSNKVARKQTLIKILYEVFLNIKIASNPLQKITKKTYVFFLIVIFTTATVKWNKKHFGC